MAGTFGDKLSEVAFRTPFYAAYQYMLDRSASREKALFTAVQVLTERSPFNILVEEDVAFIALTFSPFTNCKKLVGDILWQSQCHNDASPLKDRDFLLQMGRRLSATEPKSPDKPGVSEALPEPQWRGRKPSAGVTTTTAKAIRLVGMALLILIGAIIALNQFVKVAGPTDERSTGIVLHWVSDMFRSTNLHNWEDSAAYSGQAVDVLLKHGSAIIEDTPQIASERAAVIQHLRKAVEAAKNIDDHYLAASHPLLPDAYRKYRESLSLFLRGAETKDLDSFRTAAPLYNGFLAFMEAHKDEFKRIK
jgi:hypothetical protein